MKIPYHMKYTVWQRMQTDDPTIRGKHGETLSLETYRMLWGQSRGVKVSPKKGCLCQEYVELVWVDTEAKKKIKLIS